MSTQRNSGEKRRRQKYEVNSGDVYAIERDKKGESGRGAVRHRPADDANADDVAVEASTATTPITIEGEMPQKKFYRSRAHCNPLSHNDTFEYKPHPKLMDWTIDHYPNLPRRNEGGDRRGAAAFDDVVPDVLDIGCGFGGLTISLSKLLPNNIILGIEIRAKVTEYVRLRIAACRKENPGQFENCSVMRLNAMKYMPNLFKKSSIEKIFFCFPDPHFKKKNHPRRIISERLLSEYAYFLKPGIGRLYCITDVEDLHRWHMDKCGSHPLFRKIPEELWDNDVCVDAIKRETEEGKKVERSGAAKYYAVFERIDERDVPSVLMEEDRFFQAGEFGVMYKK